MWPGTSEVYKLLKTKNSSVSSQRTSGLGLLELCQNSSKALLQLKTEIVCIYILKCPHEKMLLITNHYRYSNQNCSEIPPYTSQNSHHYKVLKIAHARGGVKKRESSYTVGGDVNWCCHCGRPVWRFLKKLKIELPYDPTILLLGIYSYKMITQKRYMDPSVHNIIHKTWKQLICPWTDEWRDVVHIYNGILTQL